MTEKYYTKCSSCRNEQICKFTDYKHDNDCQFYIDNTVVELVATKCKVGGKIYLVDRFPTEISKVRTATVKDVHVSFSYITDEGRYGGFENDEVGRNVFLNIDDAKKCQKQRLKSRFE